MKPFVLFYIPIYGRRKQTVELIYNLCRAYDEHALLKFIVIDCKGDFCFDGSLGNRDVQLVDLEILSARSSDYWGACLNISLKHFTSSVGEYMIVCNNDTFHFVAPASGVMHKLLQDKFVLCSVANVLLENRSEIFELSPEHYDDASQFVVSVDSGVYFDGVRFSFSCCSASQSNIAPTVAIALSKEIVLKAGASLFVPSCIPHYLSDYYFTHELHKIGVQLVPDPEWVVLRFRNESSSQPDFSLFGVKSYLYLPAWIAFLLRNADRLHRYRILFWAIRRVLGRSIFFWKRYWRKVFLS